MKLKFPIDAKTFSRRDMMRLSAATAAGIAISQMTGQPAFAEVEFTIASGGGSWGEGLRAAFVEQPDFAGANGVTPSYLELTNSQLVTRLISEPANPPYSVADLQEIEHVLAADAGALQGYDLDIVTNYKDIFPSAQFAPRAGLTDWCASMTLGMICLVYNTKLASAPTSWEDLWSDKYKGKIAVPDFGWVGLSWLHAINRQFGGTEENLEPGIEAVARLVKDHGAQVLTNSEQANLAFQNEEVAIMPYFNGRAFALQEQGVPVDVAYVPFSIQLRNGFIIPKNSAFPDLANRFVNNTLDGNLQLEMSRRFRYAPTNRTVELPPDIARYAVPESALEQVAPLDFGKINAGRPAALDLWNRNVIS